MKHYHNTLNQDSKVVAIYEAKAKTQDGAVLEYLKLIRLRDPQQSDNFFSAEQVRAAVLPGVPLTSVRRALSNLYNEGLIERGDNVRGQYGHPIFSWRYNREESRKNQPLSLSGEPSVPPLIILDDNTAVKTTDNYYCLCTATEISKYHPDGWRKIGYFTKPVQLADAALKKMLKKQTQFND